MQDKIKIIIDTDIGDDADDTLAICLALKSKELEVLGITTVFRNTAARARIAVGLLQQMGRPDIPVYAGLGRPLVEEADVTAVPAQLFPEMEQLPWERSLGAVEYLRRTLTESAEPITLVTIGPLTNIGVLLRAYPEVKQNIREIVMMAGAYYMHYNELNVRSDPEAADIVYTSGLPIRAIGLDVTTRCQVNDQLVELLANCGKPGTKLLSELLLCYRRNRG
ncbi:MAG: nucleoside hydrolase, partial [Clostridium sp.]|nr:nucleoside hydrolase [Clostridium sp.]